MKNNISQPISGKLIVAFGIPGSGKSSTTREIGKILNIKTYHEPEADKWEKAVTMREIIGNFTAITWFRSMRVPGLFEADFQRTNGKTAMVDSFYDKLFYDYHDKSGIEWLFDQSDHYYEEMIAISKKDRNFLPDADIVVFFKLTEDTWREFIGKRNREMDRESEFLKSFNLQAVFLEVAMEYARQTNCKLIIHEQSMSSPETEAKKIALQINECI